MSGTRDQEARDSALSDFEHNLVLTAGAGTGKTSLLTGRVVCALLGKGCEPEELLITTFTEKAAAEMAARVEAALVALSEGRPAPDTDAGRAWRVLRHRFEIEARWIRDGARALLDRDALPDVGTFHAFCLRTLREFQREAGLAPDARIADADETLREFDELWEELLEGELGSLRPSAPILAEESWEVLLANPGLDEVRRIVRAYCALSLPEPLPWERGLEVLSSEARELLESSGELLARVGPVQKRAYEERVPPALVLMRALASAGETLDPKLREEASRLAAKPRPAPTKATPEADKPRFKDCMRRLWKLMEALRLLPAHGEIELLERLCEAAGARFRERKARAGLLEFQDCLSLTLALLRSDLRVRETLRARYKQILVDEFQDTDPLQYDILFFLAQRGELSTGDLPRSVPLERGKLCVVGDPRQSIYRFRGADMSAFEEATGRILAEHGRRLDLTVNFRSSAIVLRMVNRMMSSCIREQPGIQPAYEALVPAGAPTLFDLAGDAEVELLHLPPVGLAGTRRATEARVLARAVQEHMQRPGARFADVAFLFRSFSDVDLYARELRRRGIPVLVEGGRRFYERHEVERFVALLRVLVRPWDEAALLAYLRSPLGALPDPVLLAFVREGGRFRHLTAEEPPEEAGAELRDALSLLRKLRRAVTDLPPDEALRWVLRESGLAAIEAAGYDGAQRLANLEKLVSMVASWCAEDARSLDEAIERLERESKALLEMEESPLADPELNAVRLLTVHKAKGLEFELVVVPDLGWEPARHRDERLFEAGAGGKLLYRFSTMQASSLVRQEEIDEAHEAAEEQRLLYVAMTRAKQKLVLSLAEPGRARLSSLPWASSLAALGFDPEAPPADGAVLGEVLRYRAVSPPADAGEATERSETDLEDLERRVVSLGELGNRMRLRPAPGAPSAEPIPAVRASRAGAESCVPAHIVGQCVHAYLLGHELEKSRIDEASLESLAAWHSPGQREELLASCREILEGFLASPLRARLAELRILGREIPMFHAAPDGSRWHGSIDILWEEMGPNDERKLVVADFKTDRIGEAELAERSERYRSQLLHYARATKEAFGLEELPEMQLLFLALPRAVVIPPEGPVS